LGVPSVRVSSSQLAEEPRIEVTGPQNAPIYRVIGLILPNGDILVPGKRFSLRQAKQFAQWLDELARLGPEETRPQLGKFRLTGEQLLKLHESLSLPVGFSTKGVPRADVIRRILPQLGYPVDCSQELLAPLPAEDTIAEELIDLSLGTAFAYILRPAGLALVPTPDERGGIRLNVVASRPGLEIWPVGWPSEKPPTQLLPEMYRFLEVNIQGASVSRLIEAIVERTKVPALWDYSALARHGIDPAKTAVRFPPKTSTYAVILRHCLFQAGLKYEIRVDEADKPFLWITTTKPLE